MWGIFEIYANTEYSVSNNQQNNNNNNTKSQFNYLPKKVSQFIGEMKVDSEVKGARKNFTYAETVNDSGQKKLI